MKSVVKFALSIIPALLILGCQPNKQIVQRDPILDSANVLNDNEELRLTQKINDLQTRIGSQVSILTITSLHGKDLDKYSLRVAEKLQLGRPDFNDGLLITAALAERQIRIEVGTGLEQIIRDEVATSIIRERIAPHFSKGRLFKGFDSAIDSITHLIDKHQHLIGQSY